MKIRARQFTNNFILSLSLTLGVSLASSGAVLAQVVDVNAPAADKAGDAAANGKPLTDLERFGVLEKRYFGHGYPSDTIEDRLFRMENLVFGGKTKAPMPERIFKLEAVLGKASPAVTSNEALNPGETTQAAAAAAAAAASPKAPVAAAPIKEAPKTFTSLYDQATADIDATRYHAAADELQQAIQLNPNNAKAFSLLGDTLLKLQDREGAKEAFRACFTVDPFGADGRNAKAMLLKMVSDDTIRATAPQDTPQVVSHTIQTLNLEAADLANRYRQDGNRWASFRRYLGNIEAQKIEFESQGYGGYGYGGGGGRAGYYVRHGGGGNAGYGPNIGYGGGGYGGGGYGGGGYGGGGYGGGGGGFARREISDMGRIRSNYIRTDSQVQANNARIEAAQKAAYVQESAANLKDQLLKPKVLKDDAQLKALGTSIFCRYYGDETPSIDEPPVPEDPIQELKARAMGLTHK